MARKDSTRGPRPPGTGTPEGRRAEPPKSARISARIPADTKRRWDTWCAWHQVDPSDQIARWIEAATRGFVVQQRPTSGPAEATPEAPPEAPPEAA